MPLTPEIALVFDLDGVIVDSNPLHEVAWGEYARRLGVTLEGPLREIMYGKRNDDIVRSIFGENLSEEETLAHGASKEALYREMMRPRFAEHLVPGVVQFVEHHKKAPIALASNAERPNVDFVLENAGIRKYFRVVLDGHQVSRPKPDPAVYLLAAKLLNIAPQNCIVFEDSFSGVAAARAAGARVVGVTTTHDDLPDVDLLIANFQSAKLEPWLIQQRPH